MARRISDKLLGMLCKDGEYHKITDFVKADPYLDMEMRGNSGAIVYYRGGKILTVKEDGLSGMDEKYYHEKQEKMTPEIKRIEEFFWHAKTIVDLYEQNYKSKLSEKEIQQRVVYENNLSANADNTDYFIADVEWVNNRLSNGRADIVAFRWNHMEHRKREIQLTLIEVKQGEHAIKGKSGLVKHYADFCRFKGSSNFDEVAKDLLWVLWQKNKLELIKGLDKLFVNGIDKISINTSPDFVFLLANYHHYSTALSAACKELPEDCCFFISSFTGYGLYKDFIRTQKQLKEEFPYVFSK